MQTSLGFGWKRARKSFWTSRACWHVQCSYVCMTSWLWMEHCSNSGSCGSICCSLHNTLLNLNSPSSGVSTANHSRWLVLFCCNVILLGFQLQTLRAGCSLSAVIFSLSRSFQLPVCVPSTVTLFLSPRRFRFPSFRYFSAVKSDAVKWFVFH